MADRPFDSGLPVIPEGETLAPAPAGTQAPFDSGLPVAADPSSGWNIGANLLSLVPGMSSGGWGPQNWKPPAYDASDAAVHGATLGASDIVRGYAQDLTRGALGGDFNFGQGAQEVKAARDQYATENPYANFASNLAGGVATAPLLPGGRIFKAASELANPALRLGATALTGAGVGAGYGAAGGAIDEAPTGDWGQIGEGARRGAEWGAAFGAGLPLAVGGIGEGGRWLGQREWLPALFQGQREVRAGQELQNIATDPASVIQAGEQRALDPYTGMNVPGPDQARPTTAQLSGDVGITGKERDLVAGIAARPESTWSPAERELVQKAQAQGEARTASLQGESPPGTDPNDIRLAVQQHLDEVNQHNDNVLGPSLPPEQRGGEARGQVEAAKATTKEGAQVLYDAADPDGTLRIDQRGISADARQIVRDTPQSAKPPEGEEAAIFQRALMGGSAVPFTEFQALRGRLLEAIRTERAQPGGGNAASINRMTQLRQSMDNTLADVAASGADAGTVDRLRAANAAWRQMKETYNNQFVGPLLETRGAVGDYKVPDVNVGQRIIANNQSAQAFLAAGGDHATLRGALVDDLNRSLKGGELTPQKLQAWRSTRDGAIRAVPRLDTDLDTLTTGARAGVVGRVADAGSAADVRANVASILTGNPLSQTSRNSAGEMMRLKNVVAGNPEAEAGLKAAVIDHISDRFIDPKTGDIKPGFLRFMQEKGPAIEAAVGSDSMRVLNALVADLQRPQVARPDAVTSGRAAGAPMGLRAVLQQLGRPQQLGVGGAAAIGSLSHLAVGNPWVTASAVGLVLARTLQRHGIANQAELLAQAMNNPALARALMIKATQANAGMIERGINAALVGSHAAGGMTSDTNYSGRPPGGGSGGGTPPPEGLGAGSMEGEQSRPFAAGAAEAIARFLFSGGDPEAQASARASTAMQPVVLDYLRGVLSDASEGLGRSTYDPSRSFAANALDPRSLERATNIALGVGPGAIRAFHGSPYDFNRFDINKIGTGEGAQAYGHGLYFAENPAVAEEYRKNVLNMPLINSVNQRLSDLANQMDALAIPGQYRKFRDPRGYELANEYDRLMEQKMKPGKIYEVNINADPAQMLDWDRPTSEQPGMAQKLERVGQYQPVGAALRRAYQNPFYGGDLIGADRATPAEVSQYLNQRGIPGIRYLDQSSRGAGEGTSNYAVFDPNLIEILRKYGLAAGGALGAGALYGSDSAQAAKPQQAKAKPPRK